ncbi:MAG: helix-turn-helix domain-containing protein [archaeon]
MTDVKEYLQRLGLNSYQASTLVALFENPESDAKLLSEESGVPYTKIYETLDFLERRGLVKYTLGKPRVYQSLEPKTVFDTLLENQKEQTNELEKLEQNILDKVSVDWKEGGEKEFDSKMWMYHNTKAIWDETVDGFDIAKSEVRTTATKAACMYAWSHPEMLESIYDACLKRGVILRTVYPSNVTVGDFLNLKSMFSLKKMYMLLKLLGSKNYLIRLLPEREIQNDFIIVDQKMVGIAFRDKDNIVREGIKFHNAPIANFMINYYDTLWDKAEPIGNKWHNELKSKVKSK